MANGSVTHVKKKKIVVMKRKKQKKENDAKDYKREYCLALLWRGLSDRVRHMAVRYGNGPKMMMYWKFDMLEFFSRNHTKYFLLGHRLISGTSFYYTDT